MSDRPTALPAEVRQLLLDLTEELFAVSLICQETNSVNFETPKPLRLLLRRVDTLLGLREEFPGEAESRVRRHQRAKDLLAWIHERQTFNLELAEAFGAEDEEEDDE
jgi:hypothetical protein